MVSKQKSTEGENETEAEITASLWYRIAAILTTNEGAGLILFLATAALVPVMYGIRWARISVNNSLVFTSDLPAIEPPAGSETVDLTEMLTETTIPQPADPGAAA